MMARVTAIAARPAARAALRIGIVALVVIVVAAGVVSAGYRVTYNVWPGQGASARVHWCGRDYEYGGGAAWSWAEVTSKQTGRVRLVAEYPPLGLSRRELYAAVTPQAQRDAVSPPLPCAMGVYLRTGPGSYRPYTLLGGP